MFVILTVPYTITWIYFTEGSDDTETFLGAVQMTTITLSVHSTPLPSTGLLPSKNLRISPEAIKYN